MHLAIRKPALLISGGLIAAFCLYAQDAAPAPADQPGTEQKVSPGSLPARATPTDYQQHMQVGKITIAAEFTGHFIPTPQGTLTNEDYVAVEAAFFGDPGSKLALSINDFSLRVNGKKMPLPSQSYALVARSLKDPELELPATAESKTKTSINGSGNGNDPPPAPPKIPFPVLRAMAQRVEKSSMAEGERPLPQAGLLFFPYHGNVKSIRLVELLYEGPAGKAKMSLQP